MDSVSRRILTGNPLAQVPPAAVRPNAKTGAASFPHSDPVDRVSLGQAPAPPATPPYFSTGNKVTPLIGGRQIFPAAKDLMANAKSSIQVEMYELSNKEMTDTLIAEAKKGIQVQVLLDPSPGATPEKEAARQAMLKDFKAAGVQVATYPTDAKRRQIDHVKLLIVDGKSVLVGGMNWGDHSPVNHDADVLIQGPNANYFEKVFGSDWNKAGGAPFTPPPTAGPVPGATGQVSSGTTSLFHGSIQDMVNRNIQAAKKSVHVEMFVLTDKNTIANLIAARQRGVDVRVLLDPNTMPDGSVLNQKAFNTLKAGGVGVKWYDVDAGTRQKLHAKWATFDGQEMEIGSANWTFKGFNINHEIAVDVKDPSTVSVFDKQFEKDWADKGRDTLPNLPSSGGSGADWLASRPQR